MTAEMVRVRQDVVRQDLSTAVVTMDAPCDGRTHRVTGSPYVDVIVYARLDSHTILGVGERAHEVTLKKTLSLSADGQSLLMEYVLYESGAPSAHGTAFFNRALA